MSVKVKIPTPLQKLTNGLREVESDGATLRAVFDDLEAQFPGVKDRLIDESDEIRRFVNVYVNDEDVRFLNGIDTELSNGDDISIIPAVAGGS